MMQTMTGRANRLVFSCTAWRIPLSFPSATMIVNTGFCKILAGIVLSSVAALSIPPGSMSSGTQRCDLACLTVCSIGCGVRICVYCVLTTGCRLISEPSTAAWCALCQPLSSTLASACPSCGMRDSGIQRLSEHVPLMDMFATVRSVRPASRVGLALRAKSVDGRTAGTFRTPTTLSD